MTETAATYAILERIEAMLELDLIKSGRADFVLSKEDKDRREAELVKFIWPLASRTRAEHERNPMTHVYDGKRRRPPSVAPSPEENRQCGH